MRIRKSGIVYKACTKKREKRLSLLQELCRINYKGIKTYIFHFLLNLPKKLRRILYGLIVLLLSSPRTLYLYPKYLKLKKRIRQTKSIV